MILLIMNIILKKDSPFIVYISVVSASILRIVLNYQSND
jgi:hypothetical protein